MKLLALCAFLAIANAAENGQYNYLAHKQHLGEYVHDVRGDYKTNVRAAPIAAARFAPIRYGTAYNSVPIAAAYNPVPIAAAVNPSVFTRTLQVPTLAAAYTHNPYFRTVQVPVTTNNFVPISYYSAPAQQYTVPVAVPSTAAVRFAPTTPEGAARVFRLDSDQDNNGYHYAYQTENGIAAEQTGVIGSHQGRSADGISATGFYQYVGDDGKTYRVDYTADENGFRAYGDHLPTPPSV